MHSALPGEFLARRRIARLKPQTRQNAISILLVFMALASTLYVVLTVKWNTAKADYAGQVRSGAEIVSIVDSPYIYPDLTRLSEYRTLQCVTLADGRMVLSKKHSFVYQPQPGAASPSTVMVVGLDSDKSNQTYLEEVLKDRLSYASKHGYGLYARYLKDFANEIEEQSNIQFAKVSLMREAMFAFKDAKWLWWLDQDAVIMMPSYDIEKELLDPMRLNNIMLRDVPIMPPECVVHTYKRVPGDQIRFIATQNDRGISTASFIVSNDPYFGQVLFDYWMDPLHRSYAGFRDFGGHNGYVDASLTHMVQWHPAFLSRMAVVPHSILGTPPEHGIELKGQGYQWPGFIYLLHSANGVNSLDGQELADRWANAKNMMS